MAERSCAAEVTAVDIWRTCFTARTDGTSAEEVDWKQIGFPSRFNCFLNSKLAPRYTMGGSARWSRLKSQPNSGSCAVAIRVLHVSTFVSIFRSISVLCCCFVLFFFPPPTAFCYSVCVGGRPLKVAGVSETNHYEIKTQIKEARGRSLSYKPHVCGEEEAVLSSLYSSFRSSIDY